MSGKFIQRLIDKMGNTHFHARKRKPDTNVSSDPDYGQECSDSTENTDDIELRETKRLIKENPKVFLLNNLLMSIQFFSDFETEMQDARKKLKLNEDRLNQNLLPQKSILLPDVLLELFTDRLRFTSQGESDTDDVSVEPIRPIKMYIKYENVLVTEVDETQYYCNPNDVNAIDYNFVLKEANSKGYVRLEQRKLSPSKTGAVSDNTDISSIAEFKNDVYSDGSVYGPINKKKLISRSASTSMPNLHDEAKYYDDSNFSNANNSDSNSISSNSRLPLRLHRSPIPCSTNSASSSSSGTTYMLDSDSDSSTQSAAQHRGSHLDTNKCRDGSDIPQHLMKTVTYTYDGRIYNPKREPKPLNHQQKRIRDAKLAQNKDVVYVNGYRLAKYFYKNFKNQLGELLDFDELSVKNSKRCDATIRLEKIAYILPEDQSPYVKIEPYEVIPCFTSPWPRWARGWLERTREEWPTYEHIRHAEKFGCCLVPETSSPASLNEKPVYPLWKLDWSMSFPAAERYLETCLSASQVTVFIVALMLHKTFIKALGSSFGLETGHLRNMVFWIAEKHPEWSEQQMGQWMMTVLVHLHNSIQQRVMFDYFMPERNLFGNVNTNDLLHAQKQLKRIIENPVMFVFHAIEMIQYERADYYPRLNHAKLLRLLTENELTLRNPNLSATPTSETEEPNYRRQSVINPKRRDDSVIDIQETCKSLTIHRVSMIMKFFAEHFLMMAHCCHDRGAIKPKRAYLNQTKLLASLLLENPDYQDVSRQILQNVQELRETEFLPNFSLNPQIPARNREI